MEIYEVFIKSTGEMLVNYAEDIWGILCEEKYAPASRHIILAWSYSFRGNMRSSITPTSSPVLIDYPQ